MDFGTQSIVALATNMATTTTNHAISIAVLKKTMETQAASAAALLQAVPPAPKLPPHLGQNINTTA